MCQSKQWVYYANTAPRFINWLVIWKTGRGLLPLDCVLTSPKIGCVGGMKSSSDQPDETRVLIRRHAEQAVHMSDQGY